MFVPLVTELILHSSFSNRFPLLHPLGQRPQIAGSDFDGFVASGLWIVDPLLLNIGLKSPAGVPQRFAASVPVGGLLAGLGALSRHNSHEGY